MQKRLLLIGLGRWGSVLKRNIEAWPGLELAYEATHEWKDYLSKTDIDGVIIATRPSTHAEIALAWIEKGIPVWIEKPLALSYADAHKIKEAADLHTVPILVGHQHLFNPAFRAAKALTAGKTIRHIVSDAGNFGPYRDDYSVVWDYTPHDLSMILDIVGESPFAVTVSAQTLNDDSKTNWDSADINLFFPSGVTATIHDSRITHRKVRSLTVLAEDSIIVYDDVKKENKVEVYEGVGASARQSTLEELPAPIFPAYEVATPIEKELETFSEMLAGNTQERNGLAGAVEIVRVLEQIDTALKS